MKFFHDADGRTIEIEHKGESLLWDINVLTKNDVDLSRVVGDINGYWATLPEERQDKMWVLYNQAHDVVNGVNADNLVLQHLIEICRDLYDLMPFEELRQWVAEHGKIKYPKELRTAYGVGAPDTYLTYLRPEYVSLVDLVVALRPAIPILGEYINRIKDSVGSQFKEQRAIHILAATHLIHQAPYIRLTNYVEAFVSNTPASLEQVLNSLSSETLPDWTLAIVVTRRLALCELSTENDLGDATNVVSNLYNYINSRIENLPKSFGGKVREKMLRGRDDRAEDNTSIQETYKMKEDVAEGHPIVVGEFLKNVIHVAKRIDQSIPPELVAKCVNHAFMNKNYDIRDAQITLIQYMLNKVVYARSIHLLDYQSLVRAAGITQALLWHWGIFDLALLVTANHKTIPMNTAVGTMKIKLDNERLTQLLGKYPFNRQQINRRRQTPVNLSKDNVACRCIDDITQELDSYSWTFTAPPELIELTTCPSVTDTTIPESIKLQLADFINFAC